MGMNSPHGKAGSGPGGYGNGGHAIPLLLVGLLTVFFWVIGTLLSIEATEAWATGSKVATFIPNFGVIWQLGALFNGHGMSTTTAKAIFAGWGAEIVTLIIVVGYEAAHDGILVSNSHLTSWFKVGLGVVLIWNIFTNFSYGWDGSNAGFQIAFGLFTSFVSTFFAIIGYSLLHRAYKIWRP